MAEPVLVFPAGMPRALAYADRALSEGLRIVGSSSLGHDPARPRYPAWAHLPYVTAPGFNDALRAVIAEHGIRGIFTPNPVVWDYLNRCIAREFPGVALVNPSPVQSEVAPYHQALAFGASVQADALPLAASGAVRAPAPALEIAALFRHAETIPGMCDHEKIRALCDIFRSAPAGDVVEIGSWWGKSAFVLLRLAALHGTGKLLCVDPWSNAHLVQKDERGFVDQVAVDADEALTVFRINLLPYAQGGLNYLRLPSVDAATAYRAERQVSTPAFGSTTYAGRIAVLHVDGNHSEENARADIAAWAGLVVPGGWIVVDDYIWPYGDGPRRAGDAYLDSHRDELEVAFVMGSALFVRKRP